MGCIKLEILENYAQYEVFHCIVSNTGSNMYTQTQCTAYDPWGKRRNPNDWSYNNVPNTYMFDRGYTGHEMLDAFGLINMNGRVYDPLIARFLSPDNYVQLPDNTQGFNRYNYCLNNPLVNIDPDGNNPVAMVAIVAYQALVTGLSSMKSGDGFLPGFVKGAAIGTISVGIGASIPPIIQGSGALAGFVNATVPAAISNGITCMMNSYITNKPFDWEEWSINTAVAGAIGGISGGIYARIDNRHFITGKPPYKDVSLDVPFVGQDPGSMDCLLANSEMLEKYYGGNRTIEDFRKIYNALPEGATSADYFSAAGFKIMGSPENAMHVIRTMEVNKFPTTIITYEGSYNGSDLFHNSTVTRVRMWTPKSKAVFWVNDPIRGANYRWSQRNLYKVICNRFVIGGIQ